MNVPWAEDRLAAEAVGGRAPEEDFDRDWAFALLDRVFARLADYHTTRGRGEVFERLKGCLLGDGDYGGQEEAARELGLSVGGARAAVFQLRQRFRRYVEDEVKETVGDEGEVRDELEYLCRILANGSA